MNQDYILLTGIKNPEQLDDYSAFHAVDVAHSEVLDNGNIKNLVESTTNLHEKFTVNSFIDLIVDALRKNGEDEYITQVILAEKA